MDAPENVIAYVAFGSNLGDRCALIAEAIERVVEIEGVCLVSRSSVIETEAIGPGDQSAYLNGVIGVETSLGVRRLLTELLAIERVMGRTREPGHRWGARTIDLDLVLYGDMVVRERGLAVPHPRMHERLFVLRPLAEIAPEVVHPVRGLTVAELLGEVERGA